MRRSGFLVCGMAVVLAIMAVPGWAVDEEDKSLDGLVTRLEQAVDEKEIATLHAELGKAGEKALVKLRERKGKVSDADILARLSAAMRRVRHTLIFGPKDVEQGVRDPIDGFIVVYHIGMMIKPEERPSMANAEELATKGVVEASVLAEFVALNKAGRLDYARTAAKRLNVPVDESKYLDCSGQSDWVVEGALQKILAAHAELRLAVLKHGDVGDALYASALAALAGKYDEKEFSTVVENVSANLFDASGSVWNYLANSHDPIVLGLLVELLQAGTDGHIRMAAGYLTELTGLDADQYEQIETPTMSSRTHIHQLKETYFADHKALAEQWEQWWRQAKDSIRWDAEADNPNAYLNCILNCQRAAGRFVWD